MKKPSVAFMLLSFFLSIPLPAQSQSEWSRDERIYYKSLKNFSKYISKTSKEKISRDKVFKRYFQFDYVLKDTNQSRIDDRKIKFDKLLGSFKEYIDSVGVKNLDAKPIRFFEKNEQFRSQYKEIEKKFSAAMPRIFLYYNKNEPDNPIGPILFDEPSRSYKILSWILIDQGGHLYFLFFNIL